MSFASFKEDRSIYDSLRYRLNSSTTIEDPGKGMINANEEIRGSVTKLAISNEDLNGTNIENLIFLNSGTIILNSSETLSYAITEIIPRTGWFELTVNFNGRFLPNFALITNTDYNIFFLDSNKYSSYKFNQIGQEDGTPWRTFKSSDGSGRIGGGNLDYVVFGINLKAEIEKQWGEVNTQKYQYVVGLMLKRTTTTGTKCHILGFGTENKGNTKANDEHYIGGGVFTSSFGAGNRFGAENGGLFCAGALYGNDGILDQAGAIMAKEYLGIYNTDGSDYWGFANDVSNATLNRRYLYQDLGNTSVIRTANRTTGCEISDDTLNSNDTSYFTFNFNNGLQGTEGETRYRKSNNTAVFMGQGFTNPYFSILKNAYASSELFALSGSSKYGLVSPAAFADTVDFPDGNNPPNAYYDGDQSFDELTTVILRCAYADLSRVDVDEDEDLASRYGTRLWFDSEYSVVNPNNATTSNTGDYLAPYTFINNSTSSATGRIHRDTWGYRYYRHCKYANPANYGVNLPNNIQQNSLWGNGTVIEWSDTDRVLEGIKGVGNFLLVASKDAGHCLNMDDCRTEPTDVPSDLVNCTDVSNAANCITNTNVANAENYGVLGWDAANSIDSFCVRHPDDPICGCVNTANDENVANFIRLFEDETGLDLPNFCFSKACTDPGENAWRDPRNNPEDCPNNLQFCITLIETAGDDNTIKETDIYQDCSNLVDGDGGSGGGGGSDGSDGSGISTTTWIIIGGVVAVLVIGLIIFFVIRSRRK